MKAGEKHVLAVWADNSNDPDYPPGKAQDVLDFSYFGGIYRDVWLIATNHIYVSDANRARKVAGGGLFARTSSISDNEAVINVQADIRNEAKIDENVLVQLVLKSAEGGEVVSRSSVPLEIGAGSSATISREIKIKGAKLWTPDDPYLYKLEVLVLNKRSSL